MPDAQDAWRKPAALITGTSAGLGRGLAQVLLARDWSVYGCSRRASDLDGLRSRWPYNPAFMHPDDLVSMGLASGQIVEISSPAGSIRGIVEPDPDVIRRYLVDVEIKVAGEVLYRTPQV